MRTNTVSLITYFSFVLILTAGKITAQQAAKTSSGTDMANTSDINLMAVYDLDGHKYEVIKIGKQYWFQQNLRTTKYRDTTPIATGLNESEWKQTKKGAFAVYDNKPQNDEMYGKLYNGYAVSTGKLCPKGWRIPTDNDWKELEKHLGIQAGELENTGERGNIGDKLKTTDGWKLSSFSNNNSSGFSIKPAGARLDNGEYTTLNQYGNFWSSTVYDDRYGLLYLWNHHVHYNTHAVGRIYTLANNGYSCRCIKDSVIVQKNSGTNGNSPGNEKKPVSKQQRKDSFDLVNFSISNEWQKEIGNGSVSYIFVEKSSGLFGKIIIYKSIPGTNDIKNDFEIEWNDLVVKPYQTTQRPEIIEENQQDGWVTKAGVSLFFFNKKETGVTLISGVNNSNKISIVLLANTDQYKEDFKLFRQSIQFKVPPVVQAKTDFPPAIGNTKPSVNNGYTFTTSNFDDGWVSTVNNDYVLVEKSNYSVYLNYSVPYNASQFSGTGLRDAEFYWDNYVTKLFSVNSKQFNDGGSMALKPPYMEGYGTDKRTGKYCFIGMYLSIVPNAVSVVIGTAPDETAFRQLFPKANDPLGSDLLAMSRYNKFAIAANDLTGKWQNGNTETAQWYYVSPSGYEGYAGMTLAATSATFNFDGNGTYTSIHNGATGAVGNMNTFQQEYKGNFTATNWMVTATNRYGGKTDRFNASFMAIRGGRILKLNNGEGQDYSLVKVQ